MRAATLSFSFGLVALVGCQVLVEAVDTDVDASAEASTFDGGSPRDAMRHDAPSTDAGRRDGGEDGARSDAKHPADACSAVEDCTNGIDDNCDGLTDCEDPQCSGDAGQFSCTALPAVSGWSLVAYEPTGRPACPPHFATTSDGVIVSATGAADACECNCTNTAQAQCGGQWAWTTNGATPSCGNPPGSGGNGIANGGCVDSSGADNLNPTYYFVGAPNGVGTIPGSCSATSGVSSTPAVQQVDGETCALPHAGAGCSAGAVCAPRVPTGFQRCSIMTGTATCPNGLVQTSVYTGVDDTRGCGACSCGTVDLACNVTGMQFWTGTGCNGGIYDMSTSCQSVAGSSLGDTGGNSLSFRADLTSNGQQGACAVTSASAPSGGVSVKMASQITVCCEP